MPTRTALIIDDEQQIRRVVRHALADDFDRVLEAETGERGVDLAAAEKPGMILTRSLGTVVVAVVVATQSLDALSADNWHHDECRCGICPPPAEKCIQGQAAEEDG